MRMPAERYSTISGDDPIRARHPREQATKDLSGRRGLPTDLVHRLRLVPRRRPAFPIQGSQQRQATGPLAIWLSHVDATAEGSEEPRCAASARPFLFVPFSCEAAIR